jgi:hypothetical protein
VPALPSPTWRVHTVDHLGSGKGGSMLIAVTVVVACAVVFAVQLALDVKRR